MFRRATVPLGHAQTPLNRQVFGIAMARFEGRSRLILLLILWLERSVMSFPIAQILARNREHPVQITNWRWSAVDNNRKCILQPVLPGQKARSETFDNPPVL